MVSRPEPESEAMDAELVVTPPGCSHLSSFKVDNWKQNLRAIYQCFVWSGTAEARKRKAKSCVCHVCGVHLNRLHSCLHCVFFGCFTKKHIHEHAKSKRHNLAIELMYGGIYCFLCQDYIYDKDMEIIAKEEQRKAWKMQGLVLPRFTCLLWLLLVHSLMSVKGRAYQEKDQYLGRKSGSGDRIASGFLQVGS